MAESGRRLHDVASLVVERFGASPGAVVAASRRIGPETVVRGVGAAGNLTYDATSAVVTPSTWFDLASVTKPFVAVTLARLQRRGVIDRSERLGDVVASLQATPAARMTLDLLAAHRSGLEAHQRLFAPLEQGLPFSAPDALVAAASALRPECSGTAPEEGFPPVYSDMGYLLLGKALEARCGRRLDAIVHDEVLAPLGIALHAGSAHQLRAIDAAFDAHVAPTEVVPFRGGLVRGIVHDENAFAFVGDGLAGHAGLFGDAGAVLAFGEAILDALAERSDWLAPADLEPVLRRRPGGTHRAGFDGRGGETPSSGSRLGAETFGHLGFTGTSLWIDPEQAFVGVLLTNRVHPTREHIAIRAARPAAYDAMFDALLSPLTQ
ncbi:MAG: beta-lactamase family protein [Polyangiaceae bacterium]|nr:beta-lactamase family protein [Polyangiaceae bacterium]